MNQDKYLRRSLRVGCTAILLGMFVVGLSSCKEEKGPAERVGERVDEAVNDAKRAIEDAAD